MALTVDEMNQIMIEAATGQAPTINRSEALLFRARVEDDMAETEANGMIVEVPDEWPTLPREVGDARTPS